MTDFLTQPTEQNECFACCDLAFVDDNAKQTSCKNVGCDTFNECNQQVEAAACFNGRDFRFQGRSRVAGVARQCLNGDLVADTDFNRIVGQQFEEKEENDCRSCCTEMSQFFNANANNNLISENLCQATCGSTRVCIDQGESEQRLGCFVASDFLESKETNFIVDVEGSIVDEFQIS